MRLDCSKRRRFCCRSTGQTDIRTDEQPTVAGKDAYCIQRNYQIRLLLTVLPVYKLYLLSRLLGWLSSRVVSVLDSGAEGPGSNRSRDAVG